MGQGQLRVIININFVELEYILLHAKFHDHMTISSVEVFIGGKCPRGQMSYSQKRGEVLN